MESQCNETNFASFPGTILGEPNVAADLAHQISEPSFDSLGLGGNTPIGLIQQVMEYIHVGIGLPWWGTIIATTLVFRTLMMPLVIRGQANAAKLNNIKPELDILTQRMRDVANQQDQMKKAEASRDLQNLFLKYKCHPLKVKRFGRPRKQDIHDNYCAFSIDPTYPWKSLILVFLKSKICI